MGTTKSKIQTNSDETESYKLRKTIMDRVRENKKVTGTSIQRFIEDAIEEKLLNDAKQRKLLSKIKK